MAFIRTNSPKGRVGKCVAIIVGAMLLSVACSMEPVSPWRFSDVDRVVAVSDLHGAYDSTVATLQQAGLIDEDLTWVGGLAHLVVVGDITDRGARSRDIIDLMIRLEIDAMQAGGRVHVLLGNHEVMNMVGDNRYVSDEEFAAFADDEIGGERELWFRRFRERHANTFSPAEIRRNFDEAAPSGFFAHRRAFGADGQYGKWLSEKPIMVVINNTAFVHGGLPPYVTERGLDSVNNTLRGELAAFMHARATLEGAGVLSPVDEFNKLPAILRSKLAVQNFETHISAAAEEAIELEGSPLHRSTGPLWYRGNATCSAPVEGDALNVALQVLGASRVVIGHTTTQTRQIQSRFDGRVIEINTGMLTSSYGGTGYALVIEGDGLSIAGENGEKELSLASPRRFVGERPNNLDDATLSIFLRNGRLVGELLDHNERQLVTIAMADETVLAYFDPAQKDRRFAPELAAYRLDRMLGLDMVPMTVNRVLSGRLGTLQLANQGALNEIDRMSEVPSQGNCPIAAQLISMRVFDALIGNASRSPYSMLYADNEWQLILVGHEQSFTYNTIGGIAVSREWRERLGKLSDVELYANLGDVLDEAQLNALKARIAYLVRE